MPKRKIKLIQGEYYHFYNRGNNREGIFYEKANYAFFIRRIREYLLPSANVIAYCLMPSHYHIIAQVKGDEVSRSMQKLSISYTKTVNKTYHRSGSLFEGTFKNIHINKENYLLHLSRYIHLNPVNAGLVAKPEDWEFSSYRDFIGMRKGSLPNPEIVFRLVGSDSATIPEIWHRYRKFVESYTEKDRKIIGKFLFDC